MHSRAFAFMGVAASVGAFGALSLVAGVAVARPDDKDKPQRYERFDMKIREDFFGGLTGDMEKLAKAMKKAEETIQKNPKHGEALAWHGSGNVFMAGKEFNSGKQQDGMKHWMQGIKEMDDAVKYEPDNVGVRIVRGLTLLLSSRFVPAQMQKELLEKSCGDFEKTYSLQKDEFDKLGVHPRGELLFAMAENYRRSGKEDKATEALNKIVDSCKDSDWSKEAGKWLADKKLNSHTCIGCHTAQKTSPDK